MGISEYKRYLKHLGRNAARVGAKNALDENFVRNWLINEQREKYIKNAGEFLADSPIFSAMLLRSAQDVARMLLHEDRRRSMAVDAHTRALLQRISSAETHDDLMKWLALLHKKGDPLIAETFTELAFNRAGFGVAYYDEQGGSLRAIPVNEMFLSKTSTTRALKNVGVHENTHQQYTRILSRLRRVVGSIAEKTDRTNEFNEAAAYAIGNTLTGRKWDERTARRVGSAYWSSEEDINRFVNEYKRMVKLAQRSPRLTLFYAVARTMMSNTRFQMKSARVQARDELWYFQDRLRRKLRRIRRRIAKR